MPDDQVEDDTGILVYGGRNIAEAIGGLLSARGYRVTEPQTQLDQGWDFTAHRDGRSHDLNVNDIGDEVYLSASTPFNFLRWRGQVAARKN